MAPVAAKIYTGFNYGAFWSEQSNVKRYADFHHGFELAQNLTSTPVPFDSARLFTCITAGTKSDPTEAFQAAIDTGTNLLLGMWISPGATGQADDAQVDNELAALGKGLAQHGQKLADLIIGLSVGSEDVYRANNAAIGVSKDDLLLTIKKVRESIAASPHARYVVGKPIGHTDTAMYAVIPGSDFNGMTAYPYWTGESIDRANLSFMSSLENMQQRAGNTSVWISEMGWPINGTPKGDAVASVENYQRYWNEVGCQVFGKYNTFWYELLQDSQSDQPDWGLLDTETYEPRIKDLSCMNMANPTAAQMLSSPAVTKLQSMTSSPAIVANSTSSVALSLSSGVANKTLMSIQPRTTHITITSTITVQPTSPTSPSVEDLLTTYLNTTPSVSPSIPPTPASPLTTTSFNGTDNTDQVSVCIVMIDLLGNGTFNPVAVAPTAGIEACKPPPRFSGSPLTMLAEVTATSQETPSFDLYAPTTSFPLSMMVSASSISASPIAISVINGPTCVISAGVAYEAVVVDGRMHFGRPTPSCPTDTLSSMVTRASTTALLPSFSLQALPSTLRTLTTIPVKPPRPSTPVLAG